MRETEVIRRRNYVDVEIGDTAAEKISFLSSHILAGNAVEFYHFDDSEGKMLRKLVELYRIRLDEAGKFSWIHQRVTEGFGGNDRKTRNVTKLEDANHLKMRIASELRFVPDKDITVVKIHWR